MTDRYANGDPSNDSAGLSGSRNVTGYDPSSTGYWHGGDFKGLTGTCTDPVHGLARIKDLGFNAIWVTPPFVNQVSQGDSAGYHGYWGLDFTRVDPHLGTNQDFADFVSCAHSLGMKVILDVVPNHTGDIIQPSGGSAYSDVPYRDCHGKVFRPAAFVGKSTFPCLKATTMPRPPIIFPGLANVKKPDWLNDPTNYHNRGDIDFSSCSSACYQQGDVFGLDDLFTEKPVVVKGLVQIYSDWITKYKLDGFRIDTARHLNPGFWKLWVPKMLAAARSVGVNDFQMFGEAPITDSVELSSYVRNTALPNVLDFPFQDAATGYASGGSSALAMLHRLQDDDYYRTSNGIDPTPPTFLGNHDMGRAAMQIRQQGGGLSGDALLKRVLLGYDLMYFLRGAPIVYYGDEVGMMGSGGDKAARQDMFPTQVPDWQTEERVGSPPIGKGSSFDVTSNPIESELKQLGLLRDQYPALSTGWTIVRYAKGGVLVVSRIDPVAKREYVIGFNNGTTLANVSVTTATPSTTWLPRFGAAKGNPDVSDSSGKLLVTVPPLSARMLEATAVVPVKTPAKPKLTVKRDDLSGLWVAAASVSGPVSVTFVVRRGSKWQRLDTDTSPPYRGFIDPAKFRRNERVLVAAIVRGLDGSTAVSALVPFRVRH
ncbi:MAG: alpha-amylase [Gaiellaceae bacterium]|jgi:glycosidase|nr:alpha-amylase [Gaiellaceae bacterium]